LRQRYGMTGLLRGGGNQHSLHRVIIDDQQLQ
jgi:hypothetical protein